MNVGGINSRPIRIGFQLMPTTNSGKAIASRNARNHGRLSCDVVLPALGEDPPDYKQVAAAWLTHFPSKTLLDRHCIEKIAAASSPITSLDPQARAATKALEVPVAPASSSPAPPNWGGRGGETIEVCRNELKATLEGLFRLTEYLEPGHRHYPGPRAFKFQGRQHVKGS